MESSCGWFDNDDNNDRTSNGSREKSYFRLDANKHPFRIVDVNLLHDHLLDAAVHREKK